MTAHVVYHSGEWKKAGMDGQCCDRHPSARAQARVLFPNLGTLYMCGRCLHAFQRDYHGEFHVSYESITLNA